MGLFDKAKRKKKEFAASYTPLKDVVHAPVEGKLVMLEKVPDEVFSQGILGKGCGIIPDSGIVAAPFKGKITQVADTHHAIGLESEDGIEVLIHVGLDTVSMNGKGFEPVVSEGDCVEAGQVLMKFSIEEIKGAGYDPITMVIVTNSDDFAEIESSEEEDKEFSDRVLTISR